MTEREVARAAVALLEVSLGAENRRQAIEEVRADLDVRRREDLVVLATALAVEVTWSVPPVGVRPRLRQWVRRRQLALLP